MANRIPANQPRKPAEVSDDPSLVLVVSEDSSTSAEERKRRLIVDEFLTEAKKRWRTCNEAESSLRTKMLDDYRFAEGEQWDPQTIADRQTDERPIVTVNRIRQFIRQVTNAQRAADLSIRVLPVDNGGDVKTADVLQGLIRHIEQQSDAQAAYNTGCQHQVTMGRGWWRIVTEFEDDNEWNACLRIERVRNPFSVYVDPAATKADYSDARFMFIVEDMPRDEYRAKFGEEAFASLTEFQSFATRDVDWMPEGKVKVAEYWYVENSPSTLYQVRFPNGQELPANEEELDRLLEQPEEHRPTVIRSRPIERRKVKSALINAVEILEGNDDQTEGREWPGQWIPIVACIGDESDINGDIDLRGMVRDAKDPQRLYNYQNTALAEVLALVPKAPFIGYEGQFKGHEQKWKLANRKNFPYLEVAPFSLDGKSVPLPQRNSAGADVGGIMTAIQQSDQDLKATMGLYEPSLGIRDGNQQSGKAITALQKQGELANSNFQDNMARAIRYTGKLLIDLIPHVYDAPRIIRIIGSDNQDQKVMIHSGAPQSSLPQEGEMPEGLMGVYDLGMGKFDVVVKEGVSTANKKAEAFNALSVFIQAYPEAFPLIGDLLLGALDWPGAQAAAQRLKRAIPPEILGPEDAQSAAAMAAQLSQVMQQLEQANATVQEMQMVIQTKQIEGQTQAQIKTLENQSRERIETIKANTALTKIEAQGESDAKLAILESKLEVMQLQMQLASQQQAERERLAADRDNLHFERRLDREDALVTRRFDREDADTERQETRKDGLVERSLDRDDAHSERQADRDDTRSERTMDREDADRDRVFNRGDEAAAFGRERQAAGEDRVRDREDMLVTRKLDRDDAGTERHRDREDTVHERGDTRQDEYVTRQRDRADAAVGHKRDKEKADQAAKAATLLAKAKALAKPAKKPGKK